MPSNPPLFASSSKSKPNTQRFTLSIEFVHGAGQDSLTQILRSLMDQAEYQCLPGFRVTHFCLGDLFEQTREARDPHHRHRRSTDPIQEH